MSGDIDIHHLSAAYALDALAPHRSKSGLELGALAEGRHVPRPRREREVAGEAAPHQPGAIPADRDAGPDLLALAEVVIPGEVDAVELAREEDAVDVVDVPAVRCRRDMDCAGIAGRPLCDLVAWA